ncbi:MAG: glycosyltransferase family 39 protein [Myxococcota bacterium]|jgi:4-amino-4-deoxy-L-arabinose transferase-like glycosyltransferase|nr:glycosyltransferase family 39 protein [bacterium]MDP6075098.1 glycosyltransferase family 39 protein [Myxococcota bacterium]MDP7074792.1 glycosyltransferase family 39 protein [Myxococcota bacterium]MDP7298887.1 glycosyltransferase family 39 protein [Myxococcota bacterium]MDP7434036.1 glycosyltransferase family 39 protein [Myxococcota bacterium]
MVRRTGAAHPSTLALLAGLLIIAGGLRWLAFETARPVATLGDENYYAQVADSIARGDGHIYIGKFEGASRAWRPPAHAWLLSLAAAPDGAANTPVVRFQRLQILWGTLLVLLTALLGRALFDLRTGVLAGLLAALCPALIAHSHFLWSETLFAVLVMTGLLGVVSVARRPRLPIVFATGVVFGAAALTRELALLIAAASGLWWIDLAAPADRRAATLRGGLLLAVALAVTAPWVLRNYETLGRFVGVSTVGWFAAAEGNSLESPAWWEQRGPVQGRFHARYFSTRDELARLDLARDHALERVQAEQPGWIGKKLVRNLGLLLNPDSVVRTKVRNGAYGDRPAAPARWLLAVSGPAWLALAATAALGVAAARAGGRRALAVLLLGGVILVHVAANATPRFRVPWLPLLCIYAAHALILGRRIPSALDRRGAIGAAVVLAAIFGLGVPYFWMLGGRP